MPAEPIVTKEEIIAKLQALGVRPEDEIEVHSSLSRFGYVDGGADTVIEALKSVVPLGSIFMPALCLSQELPLTAQDKALGITVKIKILPESCERTAMGIIADTFRQRDDTGRYKKRLSAK